jgi:WD40 repeat protein
LAQSLKVGGATPLSVTRVNDTELTVELPGAASGTVSFSVNNAFGVATGLPLLQVVPQGAFGYQAVPTQGRKGGILFDPVRQSIYTANKTLQSVMRFDFTGGVPAASSTPVGSVDSVAMSPDGKSLVATSTSGKIVLLDPSTMSVQGTYSTAAVAGDALNSLPRLAVTNDGKAYFQGATWSIGMPYFDLTTREFAALASDVRLEFYSGPWFSVSGDGSRLNIVQSGSISPAPSMLYMNSSDNVLKVNPAGLTSWFEAAQSLRGERFVLTNVVYDRDFNLYGNLTLPDNAYIARAVVVAPDGSRVYLLAYDFVGSGAPRVYVFDSSTRMVLSTNLPLLGYFTIPDFPTCSNVNDYYCDTRPLGTISPDGKTLFFVGDANLVVAPIPALTPVSQPVGIQRARVNSVTVPAKMLPAIVSGRGAGH